MATISKHYGKWQAQIRIKDYPNQTKSFLLKKDAELWARQTEISLQKDDLGIRKLTPRECLRLMGFRDDFKIAVSNTQLYRQAGNSIVVDVLIALMLKIDITIYGKDTP